MCRIQIGNCHVVYSAAGSQQRRLVTGNMPEELAITGAQGIQSALRQIVGAGIHNACIDEELTVIGTASGGLKWERFMPEERPVVLMQGIDIRPQCRVDHLALNNQRTKGRSILSGRIAPDALTCPAVVSMNAAIPEQDNNRPLCRNDRFGMAGSAWTMRARSKKQHTAYDQCSDNENRGHTLQCQTRPLPECGTRVGDRHELSWSVHFLIGCFLQRSKVPVLHVLLLLVEVMHLVNHAFKLTILAGLLQNGSDGADVTAFKCSGVSVQRALI